VTDDFPDWHLVLVGPGRHTNVKQMQTSIMRLNLNQRVTWLGPLFDSERDEAYKAAGLFIQPSFQENFGNSIAEALASGCPVLTTCETPWKILQERQWGWWVPMNVESLTRTLREALALSPEELRTRGLAAKAWIQNECSVESVAGKMADWYRTLLAS
jgi:glycosyltransferase involved in cell wall biosynthesis